MRKALIALLTLLTGITIASASPQKSTYMNPYLEELAAQTMANNQRSLEDENVYFAQTEDKDRGILYFVKFQDRGVLGQVDSQDALELRTGISCPKKVVSMDCKSYSAFADQGLDLQFDQENERSTSYDQTRPINQKLTQENNQAQSQLSWPELDAMEVTRQLRTRQQVASR